MEESFQGEKEIEKKEIKIGIDFNPLSSRTAQIFLTFVAGITFGVLALFAFNKLEFPKQAQDVGLVLGQSEDKTLTQDDIKNIVDEVSKVAILPKNETPQVATVKDALTLRGDRFFENAENGDVVLMYRLVQKAYLYNVRLKKIVNIAPFGGSTRPTPSSSPSATLSSPTPTTALIEEVPTESSTESASSQ